MFNKSQPKIIQSCVGRTSNVRLIFLKRHLDDISPFIRSSEEETAANGWERRRREFSLANFNCLRWRIHGNHTKGFEERAKTIGVERGRGPLSRRVATTGII